MQFLILAMLVFPFHGELSVRIAEKTQAIQENPDNLTLYMQRGELHLQHENPDSAIIDYEYALAQGIDTSIIHVLAAEAYLAAGKHDLGLIQIEKFIQLEPGHFKGIHTRGKLYEARDELLKARTDFVHVINEAQTARPQDYIHLANLHLKIDSTDVEPAIETLELGINRLGSIISLQLKKYDIYKWAKDYKAAHLVLDQILQSLNRKERILVEKAELYMMENKQLDAASMLTKAENAIALLPIRFQKVGATKKLNQRIEELKSKL